MGAGLCGYQPPVAAHSKVQDAGAGNRGTLSAGKIPSRVGM